MSLVFEFYGIDSWNLEFVLSVKRLESNVLRLGSGI